MLPRENFETLRLLLVASETTYKAKSYLLQVQCIIMGVGRFRGGGA